MIAYSVRLALVFGVLIVNCILINILQILSLFILFPLLPFTSLFFRFINLTQRAFVDVLLLITALFSPKTRLVITGDIHELFFGYSLDGKSNENCNNIIIANHSTYADWIYIWLFTFYAGRKHDMIKIILKDSLKHIPVIGWGMWFFNFIFLKRNWQMDRVCLSAALKRICRQDSSCWLLLFPEGTVITPDTREKCQIYAQKHQLPLPKHVLLPRSTGLQFCIKHMADNNLEYIYDLTLGYQGLNSEDIPSKEITLRRIFAKGRPMTVHLHVERHPVTSQLLDTVDVSLASGISSTSDLPSLPTDKLLISNGFNGESLPNSPSTSANIFDAESTPPSHPKSPFSRWLMNVFEHKDYLMDQFYIGGRFPGDPHIIEIKLSTLKLDSLKWIWLFWIFVTVASVTIPQVVKMQA